MMFTFCSPPRKKSKDDKFRFDFYATLPGQVFTARALHRKFTRGEFSSYLVYLINSSPIICNCTFA